MAWRIHEHVVRGEIDNRIRGSVRGTIWLFGRIEPVILDLKGNARPDMAGCLLTFENRAHAIPIPRKFGLTSIQQGAVGDMTASRKVRIPDVPFDEFYELCQQGLPAPEHLANSIYIEWYSETNGRVVIESADFRLTISEPGWRLTHAEELELEKQSAEALQQFLARWEEAMKKNKKRQRGSES